MSRTVYKRVYIDFDNFNWFKQTYGQEASLSWLFSKLLEKFRDAHEITPEELMLEAGSIVKEEIEAEVTSEFEEEE